MAISGVERLVQYARDLGVEPARSPRRTEAPAPARPASASANDGIKLSLSSAASEASAASGTAPTDEIAGAETSRAPTADGPRERTAVTPTTPHAGSAVDAYRRQDPAQLGQRIAIRA